ncbi:MAG: DUF2029 domain-containing protein [Candidatus Eisenbacteria bacterium]|nr:DUF2029 domain-containing protein [Candidatus Eisenbacteria bacterium]
MTAGKARLFAAAGLLLHLAFIVSLVTGFLNPLFVEAVQGHGQASDLFGIYQAGANLLDGYSIYDSDDYLNEAPRAVPFFYFYRYLPPTAYGAALAAALFPPWTAYWIWIAVNEIMLALAVVSIARRNRFPSGRRWMAAGLWLGFTPFYIEQIMGQFSFTMAVFLWLLWIWDRTPAPAATIRRAAARAPAKGEPAAAAASREANLTPSGSIPALLQRLRDRWRAYRWRKEGWRPARVWLVWAASLVLKTFSVFLAIPYLRDGRLKRVVAGGAAAVLVCGPYFLWRPADLIEFARLNLAPTAHRILKGSYGLQTWLTDLMTHLPGDWDATLFALGRFDVSAAKIVLGLCALVVFAAACRAALQLQERPGRRAVDLLLWSAVFFLVFKTVWEYHYVMLLPGLTAAYLQTGSRFLLGMGILLALPTLYGATPLLTGVAAHQPLDEWPGWYRIVHFSVKALPAAVVFIWCLRTAQRGAAGERTAQA